MSLLELKEKAIDEDWIVVGHLIFHRNPLSTNIRLLEIMLEYFDEYNNDVKNMSRGGGVETYNHSTNKLTVFLKVRRFANYDIMFCHNDEIVSSTTLCFFVRKSMTNAQMMT